MTESKKAWVTPELIVLVRSKPEESVLANCKLMGTGPGAGLSWWDCTQIACSSQCADIGVS